MYPVHFGARASSDDSGVRFDESANENRSLHITVYTEHSAITLHNPVLQGMSLNIVFFCNQYYVIYEGRWKTLSKLIVTTSYENKFVITISDWWSL